MRNASLTLRQPVTRWMITAVLSALTLHGAAWFITRLLAGDAGALAETQRQMVIALTWMVGALVLWCISPPPSRLHAILLVLACALFVTLLGSVGALATYFARGMVDNKLLSSFAMFGGLMMLGQLALSIPSAIVLQAVALTRAPPAP